MKAARKSKARRPRHTAEIVRPPELDMIRSVTFDPPSLYLLESSLGILQEFELRKLNLGANIRKHIRELEEELRVQDAEALFARWLIEHRDELVAFVRSKGKLARTENLDPATVARWLLENRTELIELQRQKRLHREAINGERAAAYTRRTLAALPASDGGDVPDSSWRGR